MRLSGPGVTVVAVSRLPEFRRRLMSTRPKRLAFTGSFDADHHARALDAVCERLDAGARDILYIVASGAARRRAIAEIGRAHV